MILDALLDGMETLSGILPLAAIVPSALALCLALSALLSFRGIRAEYYASGSEWLTRRRDLRELVVPALLAVFAGLLVSISADLLIRGFDLFAPDWWTLLAGLIFLLCALVTVTTTLPATAWLRRRDEAPPSSAAAIRVLAKEKSSLSRDALRFLATSRRRLRELAEENAAELIPSAHDARPARIRELPEAVPAHPALPLREILRRPARRSLHALQRGIAAADLEAMHWPPVLPFAWLVTFFAFGFFR